MIRDTLEPQDLDKDTMGENPTANESFGEYLLRERQLRNISLEEISQRTRISLRVLRALEEERWEELPADVYIRGFLRTYSRYLGLDENEVLVRYEDQRPGVAAPSKDLFSPIGRPRPRRRRLWLLLVVLGFALLALYWFWGRHLFLGYDISTRPAPPGPHLRPVPMPPAPPNGS